MKIMMIMRILQMQWETFVKLENYEFQHKLKGKEK